jgi:hypothetical protein
MEFAEKEFVCFYLCEINPTPCILDIFSTPLMLISSQPPSLTTKKTKMDHKQKLLIRIIKFRNSEIPQKKKNLSGFAKKFQTDIRLIINIEVSHPDLVMLKISAR